MNVHAAGSPADNRIDTNDVKLAALREATNKLVGSVFFGTLLRTLRSSTLKGSYGHGGRGEEVFGAQLDQVLAERAGESRSYNLSEAIVRLCARQQLHMEKLRASERPNEAQETGRNAQAPLARAS